MGGRRWITIAGLFALQLCMATPVVAEVGVGDWTVGVALGKASPEDDGRLGNRQGELAIALDFGRRASESFEWGVDFHYYGQEVDTPTHLVAPLFGSLDRRASISTTGVSGTAKWVAGNSGGQVFVGGGLGLFRSQMVVTGGVFGFPAERKDTSMGLGLQLLAGASLHTERDTLLGLEWRYLMLDANFGELTRGSVDVGGMSLMLSWRTVMRGY